MRFLSNFYKIFFILFITSLLSNCKKVIVTKTSSSIINSDSAEETLDNIPPKPQIAVNINLLNIPHTDTIPHDFLGLSFETGALTDPSYFNLSNQTFVNLIKNLGGGILRIGGSTVDNILWVPNIRAASASPTILYNDDIDRFSAFAKATGWKVRFGLDFVKMSDTSDANEANYVYKQLGNNVDSFEIGNEPDIYNSEQSHSNVNNYSNFLIRFTKYLNTIKSLLPPVKFSGPCVAYHYQWVTSLANDEGTNIDEYSMHYYRMGPAGDTSVTMGKLLTFDPNLLYVIKTIMPAVHNAHGTFRYDECNSVYSGGQKGISDTFGSTLWATEYLFTLAQNGVAGVNFHGGLIGNGTDVTSTYSPIDRVNGTFIAKPVYYAMLLFKLANAKQFYDLIFDKNDLNIDAFYFLSSNGKKNVLIINKDNQHDLNVAIKNDNDPIVSATLHKIYASSLLSTTNITFDGTAIDKYGNWKPGVIKSINSNNNSLNVVVNAGSIELIVIN